MQDLTVAEEIALVEVNPPCPIAPAFNAETEVQLTQLLKFVLQSVINPVK